MPNFYQLKENIIEAFFPSDGRCLMCHKLLLFERDPFCHHCMDKITFINEIIVEEDDSQEIFFESGSALLSYTNIGKTIIQEIKFNGNKKLAKWLGKKMAYQLKNQSWSNQIDMIIAVPLHKNRLKERGFNQSEELAKGMTRAINIPLFNKLLIKVKDTPHQTDLNKIERQENTKNAFEVLSQPNIQGRTIVLVDDVYTTGSTINACAQALKKAGAHKVYCLVAATGRSNFR